MAFSESDRVQIRHFLGFSSIFLQADPLLENAITAVQSTVDGGSRPTNDTETYIKGVITNLQTIETNLQNLWPIAFALEADDGDAKVDAYRGMAMLRSEGRRLVSAIARMLATRPRADVFSGTAPGSHTPESMSPWTRW